MHTAFANSRAQALIASSSQMQLQHSMVVPRPARSLAAPHKRVAIAPCTRLYAKMRKVEVITCI